MKIAILGSGLRTPLLLHGLAHAHLPISEVVLYDSEPGHAQIMAQLGDAIGGTSGFRVRAANTLEEAAERCSFVVSSIRPGGLERRAADERLAVQHGFAGQETTGPAGFAMALRTVPVALEQAGVVERVSPEAWIVNFTNPAGVVTQAVGTYTGVKVIGICDTPAELFSAIARATRTPLEQLDCEYFGLNHLGWVRRVARNGNDILSDLLADDHRIRSLYPEPLFPPALLRALRLIPTEYLYFYYAGSRARSNQMAAGATRGEELVRLNRTIWSTLESEVARDNVTAALAAYRTYLNLRNVSYMRLEGAGASVFEHSDPGWDPFAAETGYHRIAVEAIRALSSPEPRRMVLNVANHGSIPDLRPEDVIEAPCVVTQRGAEPVMVGPLPETVQGLVLAVKAYERLAIQAAVGRLPDVAVHALFTNPIVQDWRLAEEFTEALLRDDPALAGWFRKPEEQEGKQRASYMQW
jgi:6-phospho-beta-glucosidase